MCYCHPSNLQSVVEDRSLTHQISLNVLGDAACIWSSFVSQASYLNLPRRKVFRQQAKKNKRQGKCQACQTRAYGKHKKNPLKGWVSRSVSLSTFEIIVSSQEADKITRAKKPTERKAHCASYVYYILMNIVGVFSGLHTRFVSRASRELFQARFSMHDLSRCNLYTKHK